MPEIEQLDLIQTISDAINNKYDTLNISQESFNKMITFANSLIEDNKS